MPLFAAVVNLPGLLCVVAANGRSGPHVSIAGDLAAIVEVVENSELPSQLVLVRSDIFPVHDQRGIAVPLRDVAKELIVSAIFLNHINHVMNWIFAALKANLAGAAFHLVAANDCLG